MNIKSLATNIYETVSDVFERQSTARPVVFLYEGKVGVSRGDSLGGINEIVFNDKQDAIILDTETLRELVLHEYDYDKDTAISIIAERIEEALQEA